VLVSRPPHGDLADNLTGVIIAYVAQHGGFEIAGKEEFRARPRRRERAPNPAPA
jgi:hypothetical protein